ncbi:hypothetical protein G7Y89_g1274 [Cudoniella acicularis]|uniref:2EXR domain-containing protein n=1 Tax=Cudoniella acicularis TaxID=354080 RepID=A0A8H4RWP7_9HELO|nr:hypothetical protein G7Y89_g1274 [Cudoniella acicularis]
MISTEHKVLSHTRFTFTSFFSFLQELLPIRNSTPRCNSSKLTTSVTMALPPPKISRVSAHRRASSHSSIIRFKTYATLGNGRITKKSTATTTTPVTKHQTKGLLELIPNKSLPETATTSSAVPATTFTLFTKLPNELQLKIWKAAHHPRIVVPKRSANPGMHAACHDSRTIGSYTFHQCEYDVGLLCNPNIDVLFLATTSFEPELHWTYDPLQHMDWKCPEICKAAKRVGLHTWSPTLAGANMFAGSWHMFPAMEEVILFYSACIVPKAGMDGCLVEDFEVAEEGNVSGTKLTLMKPKKDGIFGRFAR